jgi:hypothetical protein
LLTSDLLAIRNPFLFVSFHRMALWVVVEMSSFLSAPWFLLPLAPFGCFDSVCSKSICL